MEAPLIQHINVDWSLKVAAHQQATLSYIETAGQTQAFSVRANGDIYADNALSHSSDDRRKTNEQHITNAMETLNKLSPQIYSKLNAFLENGGIFQN